MKKFEELKTLIASLDDDVYKFYFKLNGASGTRIRKGMQGIKSLAQEIRNEVQAIRKKEI
jgi:hypothetical protein